jgi:hypothetical protein
MMSSQMLPWRRNHAPWRVHLRALRYNQRRVLEHVQASLFVLRYIGEEIHSIRNDVDPR